MARERLYEKTSALRNQYPDSVFSGTLGIPENRISDFMYYCEIDPQFEALVDTDDRLRLWGFLRQKSREYRSNNALD